MLIIELVLFLVKSVYSATSYDGLSVKCTLKIQINLRQSKIMIFHTTYLLHLGYISLFCLSINCVYL